MILIYLWFTHKPVHLSCYPPSFHRPIFLPHMLPTCWTMPALNLLTQKAWAIKGGTVLVFNFLARIGIQTQEIKKSHVEIRCQGQQIFSPPAKRRQWQFKLHSIFLDIFKLIFCASRRIGLQIILFRSTFSLQWGHVCFFSTVCQSRVQNSWKLKHFARQGQ